MKHQQTDNYTTHQTGEDHADETPDAPAYVNQDCPTCKRLLDILAHELEQKNKLIDMLLDKL